VAELELVLPGHRVELHGVRAGRVFGAVVFPHANRAQVLAVDGEVVGGFSQDLLRRNLLVLLARIRAELRPPLAEEAFAFLFGLLPGLPDVFLHHLRGLEGENNAQVGEDDDKRLNFEPQKSRMALRA